jgi:hypothetical protein
MVLRTDNTEVQLDDIRAICNRVFTFAWEAGFASGVNSGVKPEHLDKTKCAN